MSQCFQNIQQELIKNPKVWLITGVAGFIGSNLLEFLLNLNQRVIGLDNFITGKASNLDEIKVKLSAPRWANFTFYQGDIQCLNTCNQVCEGVDYVLHQAALCSVPDSMRDPIAYHSVNTTGFLNMLLAAKNSQVSSFTYATTSAIYGDYQDRPSVEDNIGKSLSIYAVTKFSNEVYADFFARSYDFKTIGLRYFNVFGQRQLADGAYSAVIPQWISALLQENELYIYGDGETTRDFCYIDNVIQANILAATAPEEKKNQIYNVATNENMSLNQLKDLLCESLQKIGIMYSSAPVYCDFRPGDVKHSEADISKAIQHLGYKPDIGIKDGIAKAMSWYINNMRNATTSI